MSRGLLRFEMLGKKIAAVHSTGSPWGGATLVAHSFGDLSAHLGIHRSSAAENAVALLVHCAGLEQQPNTKGKKG